MCFDYGFKILDDFQKFIYLGYFVIGCLKGFVELCGLEYVIQ